MAGISYDATMPAVCTTAVRSAACQSCRSLHTGPVPTLAGRGTHVSLVDSPCQAPPPEQLPPALTSRGAWPSACHVRGSTEKPALPCFQKAFVLSQTVAALAALHPRTPVRAGPSIADLPIVPEVAPDLVAQCLRAFPAETSPGRTGLRVQHLKDACVAGGTDAFLSHLAGVVQLLARGRAPHFVAPVLAGAGLVALPKPNGGVRPIAVGEIMRRLTGKCLMKIVRADAHNHFWPLQVGVAVPHGAEIAIHTVRAWLWRHRTSNAKVLVKLDFANAFNQVSRTTVLQEARAHFPALARWATWCYGQPTRLHLAGTSWSRAPVFSRETLSVRCSSLPRFSQWPLSSGNKGWTSPCSTWTMVSWLGTWLLSLRLCSNFSNAPSAVGLHLNLAKCELVVAGTAPEAALRNHFPVPLLQTEQGAGNW